MVADHLIHDRCQDLHCGQSQSSMRPHQERDATMLRGLVYPDPEVPPHCPDREDEHAVASESEPICEYSVFGNLIED